PDPSRTLEVHITTDRLMLTPGANRQANLPAVATTLLLEQCPLAMVVYDALLFRPLPVADAAQLVRIGRTTRDALFATVSYPEFRELRTTLAPMLDLAGHYPNTAALTAD